MQITSSECPRPQENDKTFSPAALNTHLGAGKKKEKKKKE
jgi:hypothetical protein